MLIAVHKCTYGMFFISDHGYSKHVTIGDSDSFYHHYHNWRGTIFIVGIKYHSMSCA